ncbi:MAG: hypothetical protein RBR47_14430 [Bacteroidales bacterium]|jgi:hypothetical protein|nr:hypothetical protein [Bacteroidales bacterium]
MFNKLSYLHLGIILFVFVGFIFLIILTNHQAGKYVKLNHQMRIDSTLITGNEKYGALRGAVFYKKEHFISTSAKLLSNPCNYDIWKSHGPLIDFNNEPHNYTLDDLRLPYIVFKASNNDTLFVEKTISI